MYTTGFDRYVLGLDLGPMNQPSALAIIGWNLLPRPAPGTLLTRPHYSCPTLERWPAGTPYRDVTAAVARFLHSPVLARTSPTLVIDDTGVGAPVVGMVIDDLTRARVEGHFCIASISDGHETKHPGNSQWEVPKRTLVSVMQVLLQRRRLHIASELPEAQTLVKELHTFRSKVSLVRNDTLELWREREHDDLVLAMALACWWAERRQEWFQPAPRSITRRLVGI